MVFFLETINVCKKIIPIFALERIITRCFSAVYVNEFEVIPSLLIMYLYD